MTHWLPALHAYSEVTLNCDIPGSQWLEIPEAAALAASGVTGHARG
jgi:hypothetical protein